jgi:hypothetical protein
MVLLTTLIPVLAVQGAEWIMLPGGSPTPEPPTVEVVEHDDNYIKLHITIPGFWVEDKYEGGMWFKKIWLSGIGATECIGRPELPVLSDLCAIQDEVEEIYVEVEDSHTQEYLGYHIYPVQRDYPMNYVGIKEFEYDEDFYSTLNTWYPNDNAEVDNKGHFKNFDTIWVLEKPFRWKHTFSGDILEVNYDFKVVYYSLPGTGEGFQACNVLPENALMYSNTLLNYNYLPIAIWEGSGLPNYLIVTTTEFSDMNSPYNKLKTLLQDRGFVIEELIYSQFSAIDWNTVYNGIRNIYESPSTDLEYVLIIGDNDDIPQAEMWVERHHEYNLSDYPYQCMDDDDFDIDPGGDEPIMGNWLPETHVGRLPVSTENNFNAIIDKLDE